MRDLISGTEFPLAQAFPGSTFARFSSNRQGDPPPWPDYESEHALPEPEGWSIGERHVPCYWTRESENVEKALGTRISPRGEADDVVNPLHLGAHDSSGMGASRNCVIIGRSQSVRSMTPTWFVPGSTAS